MEPLASTGLFMEFRKYNVGFAFYANINLMGEGDEKIEMSEQLIYLGQDGTAFYVEYLVFQKDAPGKFSQRTQLTYCKPTTEPTLISFQNAGFKVNSATNEYIEVTDEL